LLSLLRLLLAPASIAAASMTAAALTAMMIRTTVSTG
jgi:hypothetical protein